MSHSSLRKVSRKLRTILNATRCNLLLLFTPHDFKGDGVNIAFEAYAVPYVYGCTVTHDVRIRRLKGSHSTVSTSPGSTHRRSSWGQRPGRTGGCWPEP